MQTQQNNDGQEGLRPVTFTGIIRIEMPYSLSILMPEGQEATPKNVLQAMNQDVQDSDWLAEAIRGAYYTDKLTVEAVVLKKNGEAMPVPLKVTVGA